MQDLGEHLSVELIPDGKTIKCKFWLGHIQSISGPVTLEDLNNLVRYLEAFVANHSPPQPRRPSTKLLYERIINAGVRSLAKRLHPDAGGKKEAMQKLNQAKEFLKQELKLGKGKL